MGLIPRSVRSTTLRLAGAVAALAVTVPAVGAQAPVTAAPKPGIEQVPCSRDKVLTNDVSVWQELPAPAFQAELGTQAPQTVVSHAVDPDNPNRLAITNGKSIYVSNDGGCTWFPGLRLDRVPSDPQRMPLSYDLANILSVHISPSGAIFALAAELEMEGQDRVSRPHVLVSREPNAGPGTWAVSDEGLPPVGRPLALEIHPNGDVMYLSLSGAREDDGGGVPCLPEPAGCPPGTGGGGGSGVSAGLLWRSTDGGRTWAMRTSPNDLNGVSAIKHMSVDDDDSRGDMLWVVANGLLRLSTDGGATFQAPEGLTQQDFAFTAVESIDSGEIPDVVKLVAFSESRQMIRLTAAGEWIRSNVYFQTVESVTHRPEGDIVVATRPAMGGSAAVYRIFARDFQDFEDNTGISTLVFKGTLGWEPINPARTIDTAARLSGGDKGRGVASTFYAKTNRSVLRFLRSVKRPEPPPTTPTRVDAPVPPMGILTPRTLPPISLEGNATRTITYRLRLDPSPAPLDIYLLVDNSASMLGLIQEVRTNLGTVAQALADKGIDVQVGVGEINTQPEKPQPPIDNPDTKRDESEMNPMYVRLRQIGPVEDGLFAALDQLDGFGGSGFEAQLEALRQTIYGDGTKYVGPKVWLVPYQIKPGQAAGWRQELNPIKVIVHATDEEFSTNIESGENDPRKVGRMLKDAGILQIGLSQGVTAAHKDLQAMARYTGALAPAKGVDCDGDRHLDIRAGQPLVCGTNIGLDTTLINMLDSIKDRGVIELQSNRSPAIKAMSRTELLINAKDYTDRTFKVTYSCAGLAPGDYPVSFRGILRGRIVSNTASALVQCNGPDGVPPPRPPNPLVANEPLQPQPPPQPQPMVPGIAPVNPVAQPQTQLQPQSQVNPQAGAADQDQEQHQLAGAFNDIGIPEDEDQLAMSALDRGWEPGLAVNVAAMMLASGLAAGVAVRRRSRTRLAQVRVRR